MKTIKIEDEYWYNNGIKIALVFLLINYMIIVILSFWIKNINHYIGVGLIMCGLWQTIITLTGHWK